MSGTISTDAWVKLLLQVLSNRKKNNVQPNRPLTIRTVDTPHVHLHFCRAGAADVNAGSKGEVRA